MAEDTRDPVTPNPIIGPGGYPIEQPKPKPKPIKN